MDTLVSGQTVSLPPALNRHEKYKARIRERNERLRQGIKEGVDIDQLADELKLRPEWAKILKALTTPEIKKNFTVLSEELEVSLNTIQWIADIIGIKAEGVSNSRTVVKSREKQNIIKTVIRENPGVCDREIVNILAERHQLEVSLYRVGEIRRKNRTPEENKAAVKKNPRPPLTLAERKALLHYLAQDRPVPWKIIFNELKLSKGPRRSSNIFTRICDEYYLPSPRHSTRVMDADLFLDAAEELVRRELACSKAAIKPVIEMYLGMLPHASFKALAYKYTNVPFDDRHMEFAARHLARLSDADVRRIAAIGPREWDDVETINRNAVYLKRLRPPERETVIARRLNLLPEIDIEPFAGDNLQNFSHREIGAMLAGRSAINPAHARAGLMQQTEGIRPWPANRLFLDAAATFYLNKAGITDPKQLEEGTDGHIVHLEVSAGIILALQLAWAVRGVYFNRMNVRRRSAKGIEFAPNRSTLEKTAAGFRKNRKLPDINRLASAAPA